MRRPRSRHPGDDVILEVLPGQVWVDEYSNQPLWGTLPKGAGFVLVGPSLQEAVLPFAGMGGYGEETMHEQHLKQVHLSRLSPVMWAWQNGYPRKEWGVPIKSVYSGMGGVGNYELATPINPKGSPVWSETWQQRAAGALKRVPMSDCGCGVGNGEPTAEQSRRWRSEYTIGVLGFGALALYIFLDQMYS